MNVALAAVPLVVVLSIWPTEAHPGVVWGLAAVGVSLFWSLETVAYLRLRTLFDHVGADTIALDHDPQVKSRKTDETPRTQPAARSANLLRKTGFIIVAGIGSWVLMVWLFTRIGGEGLSCLHRPEEPAL